MLLAPLAFVVPVLQTLIVYSALTVMGARQLLDSGVKPFGPLIHTPAAEQTKADEQSSGVASGQTVEHSDASKASGEESKETAPSKPERKKKR